MISFNAFNRSGLLSSSCYSCCEESKSLFAVSRGGGTSSLCPSQRKAASPVMVLCSASSNGRGVVAGERTVTNGRPAMESTSTANGKDGATVLDSYPKSTVGGGVEDVYAEDRATEEQLATPWAVSVASGYTLLRDPRHNKGLAFSDRERDGHYLRGLLPPTCVSQELQEKKIMHNLRQYQLPLQRYMALMDLQERNERLFYKVLIDNVEELLPSVYTPMVGEACQKYGSIFRHPQSLCISLKEKGKILEVLKNWPERKIQVIVVIDGERILGLGDLGCQVDKHGFDFAVAHSVCSC